LIASSTRVYEPVFNLDVASAPSRENWHSPNMFGRQPYQEFGVKTNESFNALYGGKVLDNLYVAGAVLEGFNPISEGSGAGVSILSALHIANQIIIKEGGRL
jgi:glycerol-3-phosphate dehydrogenase subunit B